METLLVQEYFFFWASAPEEHSKSWHLHSKLTQSSPASSGPFQWWSRPVLTHPPSPATPWDLRPPAMPQLVLLLPLELILLLNKVLQSGWGSHHWPPYSVLLGPFLIVACNSKSCKILDLTSSSTFLTVCTTIKSSMLGCFFPWTQILLFSVSTPWPPFPSLSHRSAPYLAFLMALTYPLLILLAQSMISTPR